MPPSASLLASVSSLLRTATLLLGRSSSKASASSSLTRSLCTSSSSSTSSSGSSDVVDCVVVGAGVIGLACARALALAGVEVVLLEAQPAHGTLTSSRHSEVIHAGIYYPPGSLKARLCVEGKALLYDYCRDRGVAHSRLGKLIVATQEQQIVKLKQLQASAAANRVTDLQLLSGEEARALEPELSAAAALLSPSTGILDSHTYMECLLRDAERAGAVLATHSRLLGAKRGGSTSSSPSSSSSRSSSPKASQPLFQLDVEDTGSRQVSQITCRWLVNAAGLSAQAVAHSIDALPAGCIPQQHLAKGNYFSLSSSGSSSRAPFSRLIYPVPQDGGLGVHLTLDLAGQARFGPDVQWDVQSAEDYSVDPARADVFYPAIRAYWPGLPDGALQPAYSGIRPKLSGPGQPAADFVLQGPAQHGIAGLVNLFGFESPGLTASLATAQAVQRTLLGVARAC